MQYFINSNIIFDTTKHTLTSCNNPDIIVKLSNTTRKILEELITHQKTNLPVTRKHFFSVVWKTHGLTPSNGNLNQQISLIRKAFNNFGLHGSSIVTIPKQGFKLNHQLTVKQLNKNSLDTDNNAKFKTNPKFLNVQDILSIFLNIKTHIKCIIVLATMVVTMFSIGCTYFYIKHDNIKLFCCKEINTCNICSICLPSYKKYNC